MIIDTDDGEILIEKIYDFITDQDIFTDVIGSLRWNLDAHASVIFAYSSSGPTSWNLHNADPDVFRAYETYYHHLDLYLDALLASDQLRSGVVFTQQTLVSPEALQRSPLVQELLLPNGLGPILACPAHVPPSGTLVHYAFYRPPGADPFGKREISLLRQLAPHLGRASRLRLVLDQSAIAPAWSSELLDSIGWGVILLDRHGAPLLINLEAERILRSADGLVLGRSGLRATNGQQNHLLDRLIGRALSGLNGGSGRVGGDIRISRPSGTPGWLITIIPLGSQKSLRVDKAIPRAAVHVVDPLARPTDPDERLRTTFALTPAEHRLAIDLVHDCTLSEAADRRGVAVSTVKTQLLQLFAKTGTSRQSELVALLLRCLSLPTDPRPPRR